jgi:hypothetical protein
VVMIRKDRLLHLFHKPRNGCPDALVGILMVLVTGCSELSNPASSAPPPTANPYFGRWVFSAAPPTDSCQVSTDSAFTVDSAGRFAYAWTNGCSRASAGVTGTFSGSDVSGTLTVILPTGTDSAAFIGVCNDPGPGAACAGLLNPFNEPWTTFLMQYQGTLTESRGTDSKP